MRRTQKRCFSRKVGILPTSVTDNGLKLELADGQRWVVRPVDDRAASIVAELGKVMRLGQGTAGKELWAAVYDEPDEFDRQNTESPSTVVCRLDAPTDRESQVRQLQRIDTAITREALVGGGLLLHAALAEYQGSGFILAAPSETGKSTACRRLPSPWRSLSDDRTLVVRVQGGRFRAHPWPTWSRFRNGGPGGSWAVEQAVPLRAMFFLMQSSSDRLEPLNATQATALIVHSAWDLQRIALKLAEADPAFVPLCSEGVVAAKALASAVPAYSLRISAGGRFWEEIAKVLPVGDLPKPDDCSRLPGPVSAESLMARDSERMVYTGTSMSPTLQEPDLLEVRPYGAGRVRPGDVVCFRSLENDTKVAHRVIDVGPEGIRTRGDNRQTDDPWVLPKGDIIGRVVTAQRESKRRVVPGGRRGALALRCARLGRGSRRLVGSLPNALYDVLAGLGPLGRLLPASLRPRLVRFAVPYRFWSHGFTGTSYRVFLKLLMGRRTIACYDSRRKRLDIRRPFHLFVDEHTLMQAVLPAMRLEA
ncbi:MAG: SynChlorMet cassette protein ScmC [candidate division WOR-3 bacterium]|nr:MAG: SynChlorMet cassette protein ScmC [candidate division WOR-3 bacterium]